MNIELLKGRLEKRILLLDGAMGTMIQKFEFRDIHFRGKEFSDHKNELAGFNDILNLTQPENIKSIHQAYLKAGVDIISTNTFNSNSISMKDYGLDKSTELIRRINREGARIAREAIKEFQIDKKNREEYFVAGSIGPTNRSLSLSPDISRPAERNISFDELRSAYEIQIEGLMEGGVDILLFETVFDTLNLKAGLDAANIVFQKLGQSLPIMVSATISDKAGHILSGQDISAFVISIAEYDNVLSIGLNCGFGPDELGRFLTEISENCDKFISCHPNAGLPDINGCYKVSPDIFRQQVELILKGGKINIIGGCCGTTPDHIAELKNIIENYQPYKPVVRTGLLQLSGLEPLTITNKNDFVIVGERCNVAGSRKFLRLIKEGNITEALSIAQKQVEEGARILDINMDDPLLDSREEMVKFLRTLASEPEIAKVPLMIDSSNWEVIEDSLKNIQGKGIVNSLSLKEGEETFLERATRVRELGFSLIVMAFDEKGQADNFERKIEIAERAYHLLIEKCGYKPEDIIFDVNVMAVATGMREHARYALDFIKAVEWIKKNLPGARTSGGISNLSFSFRGKNWLRDVMHTVFLYHAINAGLDMAIINPALELNYDEIEPELRTIVEDVILARNEESESKLVELALSEDKAKKEVTDKYLPESDLSIEELLQRDMVKGNLTELRPHLEEALNNYDNPLAIVEGPLMAGMKTVGELFSEGKMFLPQVVKTARVMSSAIEFLSPYIMNSSSGSSAAKSGKILLATVKGDVHDIGKNIVSTVLACNNYDVIDLGVMVPEEEIINAVKEKNPDIICLSGLITPSLKEMIKVAQGLKRNGINIPLMVGGAATSRDHTALMISPEYDGPVLHMADASQNPVAARRLLNQNDRQSFVKEISEDYHSIREKISKREEPVIPLQDAKERAEKRDLTSYATPKPKVPLGKVLISKIDPESVLRFINWKMFFHAWRISGDYLTKFPYSLEEKEIDEWRKTLTKDTMVKAEEALSLYKNAIDLLQGILSSPDFDGKAAVIFEEAQSDGDSLIFGSIRLPMLRQQRKDSENLSLTDFIEGKGRKKDYMGLFAVTSGTYISELIEESRKEGDEYKTLLLQTLADRLAEASSEWWHSEVRKEHWGYSEEENLSTEQILRGEYQGIRPAWGYPMLPDQTLILETEKVIPYESLGMKLTNNGAMIPQSSVSGIYIANPEARYFMTGKIGEDQISNYARLRGISAERVKEILRQI